MPQILQEIEFPTDNIYTGNISVSLSLFSESIYITPMDGYWIGGVHFGGNVEPPFKIRFKLKLQSDYLYINTSYTKPITTFLTLDPLQDYLYEPPGSYKHKCIIRLYPISDYSYSRAGYIGKCKIRLRLASDYKLLGSQEQGHVKVNIELNSDYYYESPGSVNDKIIVRLLSESDYGLINVPVYTGRLKIRLKIVSSYFYDEQVQGKVIVKLGMESDYLNIPSPAFIARIRGVTFEIKSETAYEFSYPYSVLTVIEDAGTFLNSVIDLIYDVVDAEPSDALDISLPIWATLQSSDALSLTATITATVFNRNLAECNITCQLKKYSVNTDPKLKVSLQDPLVIFGDWE